MTETLRLRRTIAAGASLFWGQLLVRTAWVCDDAYITFRTVDNFLNGYGLRWNIANRVQTFTHPLWMFVMSAAAALTHDVYFTSIAISIALSIATLLLIVLRLAASAPMALLAFSCLAVSKSFVEFSTSGLENPLTHLLLVAFLAAYWSKDRAGERALFLVALWATLLVLNRPDTGLLVLPALATFVWRSPVRRRWITVACAMLPIAAWEAFSTIYFGFPFPNTAYAKLGHGIPRSELVQQGVLYLLDAVSNDPITPLVIAAALLTAAGARRSRAVMAGVVLYVGFVVWVGGDFMSGRMLAAPFLCSVVVLASSPMPRFSAEWAAALALIWLTGLSAPRPVLLSGAGYGSDISPDQAITATHINDERRYYYPFTGLLTVRRGTAMPAHRWFHLGQIARTDGTQVAITDAAGFIGYAAGPHVHYVDRWGLGDPLLARLPAEVPWQIGHFTRTIPEGYIETLTTGRDSITDPGVAAYYEKLRIVTEWPVWRRKRLGVIVRMNLGKYEALIEEYGITQVAGRDLAEIRPDGTAWTTPGNAVTRRAIRVRLEEPTKARTIELSVSRNDNYRVEFRRSDRFVAEHRIRQPPEEDSSLRTHVLTLPSPITFDTIELWPSDGDGRYALGHVRIVD